MASTNIETFVIVDLEGTGLPEEGSPKITELCFLAVSKQQLENNENPRVIQKLLLCFNPEKPIIYRAQEKSGLCNTDLANLRVFGEQASLLRAFLQGLPRPVCLIAHGGKRYDFPLLRTEFAKAGIDVPDLLCADTLEAFQALENIRLGKGRHTLSAIYARHFGCQPEKLHTAEADCLTLLKIIHKNSSQILPWFNRRRVQFINVAKMY